MTTKVKAVRTYLSESGLGATSPATLGRTTHRGTSVLDSLRYGLKTLGSGQVPLLSDILTDTAEGVPKTHSHLSLPGQTETRTITQAHTCLSYRQISLEKK